jgi:hypothetical protein
MKLNSTDKVSCPILRRKVDKSWCYGCASPCIRPQKSYKTQIFEDCEPCDLASVDLKNFLKDQVDPHGIKQHEMGAKLDAHKIKAGVLGDFGRALEAVAQVGTFGITKYARGSWQHVPDGVERYSDALWRHLLQESYEELDQDSNLLHAAHTCWNCLAKLELILREKENERNSVDTK